jgi:hypothetical protein
MMPRTIINRSEMLDMSINLGGPPLSLADYATTGLVATAIGPRGCGKSSAGLLIAEQLSVRGWICVLIDPEGELEALYGTAVESPAELAERLRRRDRPIIVVSATDAGEFIPYGEAILEVSDERRQPIFVMLDEGQLFSASGRRGGDTGEATRIVNEFVGRGRKRALDVFITALRFTGTLQRQVFSSKNLTLIGTAEDPTGWAVLAPQFKGTKIEYKDLNALAPGEFFCLSRRGVEKIRMPMAEALKGVAPKARTVKRTLPTTFQQWSRAMSDIPTDRLECLTPPVIQLLSTIAGLSMQQTLSGTRALRDELEGRG